MCNVLFDNVIIVDYDGVCAYWEHSFAVWMFLNGYGESKIGEYELHKKYDIPEKEADLLARMFNESAGLSNLPPMRDAIKYIRKLHEEHGYVFHCISAIMNLDASRKARWDNIYKLFGETTFERLILCGNSENKDALLSQYKGSGCYWIEDVAANAEYGLNHGLKPLIMRQHYNESYENPLIPKVNNWKEIYEYIVGDRVHPT